MRLDGRRWTCSGGRQRGGCRRLCRGVEAERLLGEQLNEERRDECGGKGGSCGGKDHLLSHVWRLQKMDFVNRRRGGSVDVK